MDDILMIDWNKQLDVGMDFKSSWSTCELWNMQSTRIGDLLETVVVCCFSPQIWKLYWTFIHMSYVHHDIYTCIYIYIQNYYLITYIIIYIYIYQKTDNGGCSLFKTHCFLALQGHLWRRCDAVVMLSRRPRLICLRPTSTPGIPSCGCRRHRRLRLRAEIRCGWFAAEISMRCDMRSRRLGFNPCPPAWQRANLSQLWMLWIRIMNIYNNQLLSIIGEFDAVARRRWFPNTVFCVKHVWYSDSFVPIAKVTNSVAVCRLTVQICSWRIELRYQKWYFKWPHAHMCIYIMYVLTSWENPSNSMVEYSKNGRNNFRLLRARRRRPCWWWTSPQKLRGMSLPDVTIG